MDRKMLTCINGLPMTSQIECSRDFGRWQPIWPQAVHSGGQGEGMFVLFSLHPNRSLWLTMLLCSSTAHSQFHGFGRAGNIICADGTCCSQGRAGASIVRIVELAHHPVAKLLEHSVNVGGGKFLGMCCSYGDLCGCTSDHCQNTMPLLFQKNSSQFLWSAMQQYLLEVAPSQKDLAQVHTWENKVDMQNCKNRNMSVIASNNKWTSRFKTFNKSWTMLRVSCCLCLFA